MTIGKVKVDLREALEIERRQRKKYGATVYEVLLEESKKFNMSVEEFLNSPETSKRLDELSKVFELMDEKEFKSGEVLAGAPGLGKHKS